MPQFPYKTPCSKCLKIIDRVSFPLFLTTCLGLAILSCCFFVNLPIHDLISSLFFVCLEFPFSLILPFAYQFVLKYGFYHSALRTIVGLPPSIPRFSFSWNGCWGSCRSGTSSGNSSWISSKGSRILERHTSWGAYLLHFSSGGYRIRDCDRHQGNLPLKWRWSVSLPEESIKAKVVIYCLQFECIYYSLIKID